MNGTNSDAASTGQDGVRWRKSTFSPDSQCVEVAELAPDVIGVRNSNHRDAGTLPLSRAEFGAWIRACKAGEFDDLA